MNPALLKPAPTGAATLVVGGRSVFPHMTVIESLIEAPRLALKESKAEATERERGLLEHVGFARDGAGQQRLTRARGADEQHAARNAAAKALEFLGIAQEFDDFFEVLLGFVHAGNVSEGDAAMSFGEQLRL